MLKNMRSSLGLRFGLRLELAYILELKFGSILIVESFGTILADWDSYFERFKLF